MNNRRFYENRAHQKAKDNSVTGTYDGTETLDKKMERIMAEKFTEKLEDSE